MKFFQLLPALSLLALVRATPTPKDAVAHPDPVVQTDSVDNTTASPPSISLSRRQLPGFLPWEWFPIVFGNGVPVGGSAHLTINQDGSYSFSGHFHDSGATSYNTALVWAVKDCQNMVYTFSHSGHVSGTFSSGSRDDDWGNNGFNQQIKDHWQCIAQGWTYNTSANVNMDIGALFGSVVQALGVVAAVIAIV